MSGHIKGVQSIIREKYPAALYVHCSAHSLNLALSHSCQVKQIRNCIGGVKTVGNFFKSSPKRTERLTLEIQKHVPQVRWQKLITMCETRWIENPDALIRFKEMYIPVVKTLEGSSNCDESAIAKSYLKLIVSTEFVISLYITSELFSHTLPLCRVLQSSQCDLSEALRHVARVQALVKKMKSNLEEEFNMDAEKVLKNIGREMRMPRTVNRQVYRENVPTISVEENCRKVIAIPFLDDFSAQLQLRFLEHEKTINELTWLLPSRCNTEDTVPVFSLYEKFLDIETLKLELKLWKERWREEKNKADTALSTLDACNKDISPIYTLYSKSWPQFQYLQQHQSGPFLL